MRTSCPSPSRTPGAGSSSSGRLLPGATVCGRAPPTPPERSSRTTPSRTDWATATTRFEPSRWRCIERSRPTKEHRGVSIRVEHLSKRFAEHVAVDDVSFEVQTGELVALLGPSGGGKSTILRIIAGLEPADQGTVRFDGAEVEHRRARDRRVGVVVQHYALFRHLSVWENVAFGLRVQKVPRAEADARVGELLKLVGLESLGQRWPAQLSGGQR